MAYNHKNLDSLESVTGRGGRWAYHSHGDAIAVVTAANFFSDGLAKGMRVGDVVEINVYDATGATHTGTVGLRVVSAINAAGAVTVGSSLA